MSWIAFRAARPAEVLAAAGLRFADGPAESSGAPFHVAAPTDGWTVLFADDVMFAEPDNLRRLSLRHEVVGCMIEEHAMASLAAAYRHGSLVWQVVHDIEATPSTLLVSGTPPPELSAVRDLALRDGGIGAEDEFDIPIALAEAICGFRHDESHPDWDIERFTAAVPA